MKIKTFQAMTMTDALRTIKEELGPDAVILSTKSVKQQSGMFGLFGRTSFEVTAAIDFDPKDDGAARREPDDVPTGDSRPATRQPAFQDTLRSSMRQGGAARVPVVGAAGPQAQPPSDSHQEARPQAEAVFPGQAREEHLPDIRRLAEEVRGLRQLVEANLAPRRTARRMPSKRLPAGSSALLQDLVRAGVEAGAAEQVLDEAAVSVQGGAEESDLALRRAVHQALTRCISVSGPLLNGADQKKTVIFVGPTGVGKTTTIAKLAAHYTLKEQRSVSLITLDTYRVAAVEQLRMYAKVIGVTLDVALTKRDALDFIRRRSRSELILIDTAGRSPMDEAGLQELRELVSLDHPLETHLVLASTTREQDLIGGATGYAGIPITRLLFTKLDETCGYGGLFVMARNSGVPLSYFSTGQNVPEDLEVATPERVADLVLGHPLRGRVRAALSARA